MQHSHPATQVYWRLFTTTSSSNLVAVPKILGRPEPSRWDGSGGNLLEIRSFSTCVTLLNLVVLHVGQAPNYGDPLKKF